MATSPHILILQERVAEAFLKELQDATPKSLELINEIKGPYSACNPDPSDPDARTLSDEFDSIRVHPDAIAYMQQFRQDLPTSAMSQRPWARYWINSDSVPLGHSSMRLSGSGSEHSEIKATGRKALTLYEYERSTSQDFGLGIERTGDQSFRVTESGYYHFTGVFNVHMRAYYTDEEIATMGYVDNTTTPTLLATIPSTTDEVHYDKVYFGITLSVYRFGSGLANQPYQPLVIDDDPLTIEAVQHPYVAYMLVDDSINGQEITQDIVKEYSFNHQVMLRSGDELVFHVWRGPSAARYAERKDALEFKKMVAPSSILLARDSYNFIQFTALSQDRYYNTTS